MVFTKINGRSLPPQYAIIFQGRCTSGYRVGYSVEYTSMQSLHRWYSTGSMQYEPAEGVFRFVFSVFRFVFSLS